MVSGKGSPHRVGRQMRRKRRRDITPRSRRRSRKARSQASHQVLQEEGSKPGRLKGNVLRVALGQVPDLATRRRIRFSLAEMAKLNGGPALPRQIERYEEKNRKPRIRNAERKSAGLQVGHQVYRMTRKNLRPLNQMTQLISSVQQLVQRAHQQERRH